MYSCCRAGTSLQLRLKQGVFSNVNDINIFLMIFMHEPPLQASSSPILRVLEWLMKTCRKNLQIALSGCILLVRTLSQGLCAVFGDGKSHKVLFARQKGR